MDERMFQRDLHLLNQRISEMSLKYAGPSPLPSSFLPVYDPSPLSSLYQALETDRHQHSPLCSEPSLVPVHDLSRLTGTTSANMRQPVQVQHPGLPFHLGSRTDGFPPARHPACSHSSQTPPYLRREDAAISDAFFRQIDDLKAQINRMERTIISHHQTQRVTDNASLNSATAQIWEQPVPGIDHNIDPWLYKMLIGVRHDCQAMGARITGLEAALSDIDDRLDLHGVPAAQYTPAASVASTQDEPDKAMDRALPDGITHHRPAANHAMCPGTCAMSGPQAVGNMYERYRQMKANDTPDTDPELTRTRGILQQIQARADLVKKQAALQQQNGAGGFKGDTADQIIQERTTQRDLIERMIASYQTAEINRLTERLGEAEAKLSAKDHALSIVNGVLTSSREICADKATEIEGFQRNAAADQTKIDWYSNALSDSVKQCKSLESQQERLEQCLADCRGDLEGETDRVISTNEKMTELRSICEQKDALIYEQDHIIARGAHLLEQRDEEIESLHRRERNVAEKFRRMRMDQDQFLEELKKGLAEKDGALAQAHERLRRADHEIERLKSQTRQHSEAQCKSTRQTDPDLIQSGTRNPNDYDHWELPSYSAQAQSRNNSAETSASFDPQTVAHDRAASAKTQHRQSDKRHDRRPHRRHHATNDDLPEGATNDGSDIERSRTRVGRDDDQTQISVQYLSDEVPATSCQPDDRRHRVRQQASHSGRHRTNGSEGRLWWPPLPAPVEEAGREDARVQKARSMMDLRSVPPPPHRSLAKHQSMQRLPRRQLQAYVETDAEADELENEGQQSGRGGDFGGDV